MAKKFLISRLSSLGDVVNTLPTANALKQTNPDCSITWLVDPRFAGIVELCTDVDRVIKWKPDIRKVFQLQFDEEFDIAFDMQGLLKSAVPVWRAKAQQSLGYHWQREGSSLLVPPVLPRPNSFHIVDQLLDVIRGAGFEFGEVKYSMKPDEGDISIVTSKLRELGIDGRFVAINAGSAWKSKRWNPVHFAHVIDELNSHGVRSVLVGTKAQSDRDSADSVIAECASAPIDMLGQTSVRELIALLSLAAVHLAGDTGSLHIANALGTPIVAIYSTTKPHRTGPYLNLDSCHYDSIHLNNIRPQDVANSVVSKL